MFRKIVIVLVLLIVLIASVVIGFKFVTIGKEDKAIKTEETSKELEIVEKTSISFDEMMDLLYPEKETSFEISGHKISAEWHAEDQIFSDYSSSSVYEENGEYFLEIHNIETEKFKITGIQDEIVSAKINPSPADEGIPLEVYFLTRSGNIYYINNFESKIVEAKKIEELQEIISLSKMLLWGDDEGSYVMCARTLDSKTIPLSTYVYKNINP